LYVAGDLDGDLNDDSGNERPERAFDDPMEELQTGRGANFRRRPPDEFDEGIDQVMLARLSLLLRKCCHLTCNWEDVMRGACILPDNSTMHVSL
jgi:hypothetical protein